MILVDSSVWIDHFRSGEPGLIGWLEAGRVLTHPFVIGELALGSLRGRQAILTMLSDLPAGFVASDQEVLHMIDREALHGQGIGYVDTHLLASVRLTPKALLWTRDRRLASVAARSGVALAT